MIKNKAKQKAELTPRDRVIRSLMQASTLFHLIRRERLARRRNPEIFSKSATTNEA